jgi:hypothetical protein
MYIHVCAYLLRLALSDGQSQGIALSDGESSPHPAGIIMKEMMVTIIIKIIMMITKIHINNTI